MINFLEKEDLSEGFYCLLRRYKNKLIVEYSSANEPASVYAITFKSVEHANLDSLLEKSNVAV